MRVIDRAFGPALLSVVLLLLAGPAHAHGDMLVAAIVFGAAASHVIALAVAVFARAFKVGRLFVVAIVLIPIGLSWLWMDSTTSSTGKYWFGWPMILSPWLTLACIRLERSVLSRAQRSE